ncbi:MAG: DegT/DnrJ/EryC1/StrS family aminotransferase, partial [Candidatus Kapabacteria bacterium]|nr:DegT/DnrJ/EryC1/StrS family aminotransferase [Candidatus Kapabacteria bacterium]
MGTGDVVRVPFLNLAAQHEALQQEIEEALQRVIRSYQFVLGSEVEELEQECAAYLHLPYAVASSSGTDALLMVLMGLGIGPGDEVIVPTWTFYATASVAARLYARPVFADTEPRGFGIRTEEVERRVTPRTRAVIVAHLYGQIAPATEAIREVCKHYGIALIEDAAQAFGAQCSNGLGIGRFGLCACVSFYPTKNLGAWGDAGMVVTQDAELAGQLRLLRNHGMEQRYLHRYIGGNFRMDALQAAVLRVKLRRLAEWNARRRALAHRYERLFQEAGLAEGVGAMEFD